MDPGEGANGPHMNSKMDNSILIGAWTKPKANNETNQIVIGYNAIGNGSNTIQLGNTSVTNLKTSGTITAGGVTYPNIDGTAGQVLTANANGIPTWTSASSTVNASSISGIVAVANGGTGVTSSTGTGSVVLSNSPTFSGAVSGNNNSGSSLAGFSANMNTQTGTTYTVTTSDNGKIITLNNASAITLTVPTLFAGFNCMIVQLGDGKVTLTASGVTISNRSSNTKTAGANAIATILGLTSTTFISSGDMIP
jgi:hypothetical protein